MREILKNWGAAIALAALMLIAFHFAMQADARNQCSNEATATAAVCAQAGMS